LRQIVANGPEASNGIGQKFGVEQASIANGEGMQAYSKLALVSGVTGGVMAELQGGRFGNGFVSAGVNALLAPLPEAASSKPGVQAVYAAVVGGTVSRISGGKFANGAITGAIMAAMSGPRDGSGAEVAGSGDTDVSAAASLTRETVAVREIYDVGYVEAHQQVGAEMAAYAQNGGPELCTAACPIQRTNALGLSQQGYRFTVETINSNVACANSLSCGNMTAIRSMHVHGSTRYRVSSLDARLDPRLSGKVGRYSMQDVNNFSGTDKLLNSNFIYSPNLGLRLWQKYDRSVIDYGK
jgi:hypothetical protein